MLKMRDERGRMDDLAEKLDLRQVMDRNVENLSGGELQRFAIAMCAAGKADVYMIDEPSSYLDVRQRLKAAQVGSQAPCSLDCFSQLRTMFSMHQKLLQGVASAVSGLNPFDFSIVA